MIDNLLLRPLRPKDAKAFSEAFRAQGWNKPARQFNKYFECQQEGHRAIIVAEVAGAVAGYLTIKWESDYTPFRIKQIPEIVDFNVLKKFQRQRIGTALMDEAERRIKQVAKYAGIGFGLYKDYGPAQILYVKRNYIPDGKGIVYNSQPLAYNDEVRVDDGLVLYLLKAL